MLLSIQLGITDVITDELISVCVNKLGIYGEIIFWLIIGMILASIYNRYIGTAMLRKAYEKNLHYQDKTISGLTAMINERLNDIKIEQKDKKFFQRLKNYFYQNLGNRGKKKA